MFIVSAPSGAGKSTLCRALQARFPAMRYSVSYTTRKPRGKEIEGVDYHFISEESFQKGITDGIWAEWAQVHGHYYGTSAEFIDRALAAGENVLLDIDVQGTRQISARYPESVTIFIMPPSLEALRDRLQKRGTDESTAIEKRLENAAKEMAQKGNYRHVVVNDRLPEAVEELTRIVAACLGLESLP